MTRPSLAQHARARDLPEICCPWDVAEVAGVREARDGADIPGFGGVRDFLEVRYAAHMRNIRRTAYISHIRGNAP